MGDDGQERGDNAKQGTGLALANCTPGLTVLMAKLVLLVP